MQLLDPKDYYKANEALSGVTINNLFARAVVEHHNKGAVYVDDVQNPTSFYIALPFGMSLLLGDTGNKTFNEKFRDYAFNTSKQRTNHEWMQAFPASWNVVLQELFAGSLISEADNRNNDDPSKIELNIRVNFRFNKEKFLARPKQKMDDDMKVVRADGSMFREMKGSVIPHYFFTNEEDFLKRGFAFCVLYKGELASMAFSAFCFPAQVELGIETDSRFRGKGFAEMVCAAFIDHCLERNVEPVWACRRANNASYQLAQKLGFELSHEIPYYRLAK